MNLINLQKFLQNLTVNTPVDGDFEFLKVYDKDCNSIFDKEEISEIKQDLFDSNNVDGDKEFLSISDLLDFQAKTLKRVSTDVVINNKLTDLYIWLESISKGKYKELLEYKKNDEYKNLTDIQKEYMQVLYLNIDNSSGLSVINILKNSESNLDEKSLQNLLRMIGDNDLIKGQNVKSLIDLSTLNEEEFQIALKIMNIEREDRIYGEEAVEFIKKVPPEKIDKVIKYLSTKVSNSQNELDFYTISSMMELDDKQQNKVVEILNKGCIEPSRYRSVPKLMKIYEYLPENFFEKYPDFRIKLTSEYIGLKPSEDADEVYLYEIGVGLIETRSFDTENKLEKVINTKNNIEQTISEKNGFEEVVIKKYDKLDFDENNQPIYGEVISTQKVTEGDILGVPNISMFDNQGNEDVIQFSKINDDGTTVVKKEFVSGQNLKTKFYYEESENYDRNLSYQISNGEKIILNKNLQIKQTEENKFLTIVDGKKYEATFNKNSLVIVDLENNITKNIDISKKFIKEGKEVIVEILKNIPANLLFAINELQPKSIAYDKDQSEVDLIDNGKLDTNEKSIYIGSFNNIKYDLEDKNYLEAAKYLLSIFTHEFGHLIDSDGVISSRKEIKEIFEKELAIFLANSTLKQQEDLEYLIENDDNMSYLKEQTADTLAGLYSVPNDVLSRINWFQMNFPQTIAKHVEFIEERLRELK